MIRLQSGSFAYDDGVPLLSGVTVAVEPGEYLVVAGASGSGKTTLARLLAGAVGTDAGAVFRGSLTLDGETVRFEGGPADPRIDPAVWSASVAFVAQGAWGQLSMMSATVGEEIAFGPSNRGVPYERLRREVDDVAAALKLTELLDRDPRRLSGGQLQRTIIAAAVVQRPRVLVLDEPFQGLDAGAAADVSAAIDVLRAGGTGVVVCAPMLPRTAPEGARIIALDGGHPVFDGLLAEARWAGLRRYGIGTEGDAPRIGAARPRGAPTTGGRTLVTVDDVVVRYPSPGEPGGPGRSERRARRRPPVSRDTPAVLDGVSLQVRAGEILAVRGSNGSGKTTLLQVLNGLRRPESGRVTVDGTPILRQPTGTFAGVIGYLFQDTDQQLFERTVLREVSYGPRAAGLRRVDALRRAADALEAVGLSAVADIHPYELAFVQRRLVALASLIAAGPSVWVLDEPTAGLDEPARTGLAALLVHNAQGGGAVVMATHDAAFSAAVAHRILRLEAGLIQEESPGPVS